MARFVAPGVAHHVTQRGTSRQRVFLCRYDRRVYLELLREQARHTGTSILAYCLMPNHVHLIAVPADEDGLAVLLRRVHGRFAQYFNARRLRTGHLWQNRFFSCPMSSAHLWTAIRYVESNPVRASLAQSPSAYEWSSAEAHLSGIDRRGLLDMSFFAQAGGVEHWRRLFGEPEEEQDYRPLRKATHAGQPFGDKEFTVSMLALRAAQLAGRPGLAAATAAAGSERPAAG
jgi:putative transposase